MADQRMLSGQFGQQLAGAVGHRERRRLHPVGQATGDRIDLVGCGDQTRHKGHHAFERRSEEGVPVLRLTDDPDNVEYLREVPRVEPHGTHSIPGCWSGPESRNGAAMEHGATSRDQVGRSAPAEGLAGVDPLPRARPAAVNLPL